MALSQVGLERLNTTVTNKIGENKNLVINGQFDIWQRATDSGSNTTDGVLACDRWMLASSGATKQVTRQTFALGQTDVPSNPKYFLRYAVTVGNNNVALRQRIEGVANVQGTVTLSFYAKGTNPGDGTFNITNRQDFGTGGSASSVVDTGVADFTVTTNWAKKTFTFTPPSISGKTLGTNNNDYYELEIFRQPAADTSTAAYTIDIANVQLEVGSVATDFEHRSFAEELRLCQRYYQQLGGNTTQELLMHGTFNGAGTVTGFYEAPVEFRTRPSFSISNVSHVNCYGFNAVDAGSPTSMSLINAMTDKHWIYIDNALSSNVGTGGLTAMVRANSTNDCRFKLDAEL